MRRLKNQIFWLMTSIILVSVFMNCGPAFKFPEVAITRPNVLSADPAKSAQAKSILQNKCASCHSQAGSGQLTNVMNDNHLLNGGFVVPGDVNGSSLVRRIADGTMPPGQPLPQSELNALNDWIRSMAPATIPGGGTLAAPGGPVAGGGATPTPAPTPTPNPGGGSIAPTFANVYSVILSQRCVGCHANNNGRGGYGYATYQQTLRSVNTANPAASLIYRSVLNDSMPENSAPLAASEKKLILDWITAGALNN